MFRVVAWIIVINSLVDVLTKIIITKHLVLEFRSGVKLIKIHNYLNEGATEFRHLSFSFKK